MTANRTKPGADTMFTSNIRSKQTHLHLALIIHIFSRSLRRLELEDIKHVVVAQYRKYGLRARPLEMEIQIRKASRLKRPEVYVSTLSPSSGMFIW